MSTPTPTVATPLAADVSRRVGTPAAAQSPADQAVEAVGAAAGSLVKTKAAIDSVADKVAAMADMAKKVAGDNSPLAAAAVACKRVFAVGQSLPFVAPIFTVLQVIVDIELRAREADAKCSDLLERITFMVEQLSALESVTVPAPTEKVISRMEQVLKDAAALIGTYRKLGAIARRLNTGNKERFASCAKDIEACTNDLMVSLQIHQTAQLSILTRAVRVDEADEAADAFLKEHGGLEAVKSNPELVKLFASEIKVQVDDASLKELNSNIGDLIAQNRIEMESKFKESMSEAVADGIKSLAATMRDLEREEVFGCVQCGQSFRESTNAQGSCSFHESPDLMGKAHMCCNKVEPCKRAKHRSKHHCDYRYAAFFARTSQFFGYSDTIKWWARDEVKDFESRDEDQTFGIGRLLRWQTRTKVVDEALVVVHVGHVYPRSIGFYFDILSSDDLAAIAARIAADPAARTIYRVNSSDSGYTMGEWLVGPDGAICGVRMTAKPRTLDNPVVQVVRFNPSTMEMIGDIEHVSRGFVSFKPDRPYELPPPVFFGRRILSKPVRDRRTDFKTRTSSPDFDVLVSAQSNPALSVNTFFSSGKCDKFEATVMVFNKMSKAATIMSASAAFRLVGDPEYHDVAEFVFDEVKFPISIEPLKSLELKFAATVPLSDEDYQIGFRWWNRSVVARFRPLRMRLTLTDINDNQASFVMEYVFTPFRTSRPSSSSVATIEYHDWNTQAMFLESVEYGDGRSTIVQVSSTALDEVRLNRIVYTALKTGVSEVDLEITRDIDTCCIFKAWALVDLNCRRVYAFKLAMVPHESVRVKTGASMIVVACPDYGSNSETRPIQPAVESAALPELQPLPDDSEEQVIDDDFDDIDPFAEIKAKAAAAAAAAAAAVAGGELVGGVGGNIVIDSAAIGRAVGEALDARLSVIETNLERTATALEGLVAILKTLALKDSSESSVPPSPMQPPQRR
ncbi:hypothetical protein HK105_209307 [Polyrhizophydium stewartii]|uniref:Uncharacterized protein n=1 Tax=Polyrhizophydium stewartii TaxID=2732419 RepID=A0ABR4MVC7_9FUNG|nr:hypothetical protein HK105_008292 [Polyrhizophydium stewartii]